MEMLARRTLHRHLLDIKGEPHLIIVSPPPTYTPAFVQHGGPYRTEPGFDTNMVIILVALICALICALGMNSIVRCALRCRGHFTGRTHHPNSSEPAGLGGGRTSGRRGLRRSTIRQIPVVIFDASPSGRNDVISTDCIICLGEFVDGEKMKVLPKCKHGFHSTCIDTWLFCHSSCPTCRQLLSESAGNAVGSVGIDSGSTISGNRYSGGGGGQEQLTSDVEATQP